MSRNALVVFGKNPIPGRVKTRLGADLGDVTAAVLYRAFLLDTLRKCSSVDAALRLYLPPTEDPIHPDLAPFDHEKLRQRGLDLGERMKHAIEETLDAGFARVVIVGSDHPTLPVERIHQAFDALAEAQAMVIGPSYDGGYYLLGLTSLESDIFDEIAYGRPDVLAVTVSRAQAAGLDVVSLKPWYDVDTIDDIRLLLSDVSDEPSNCPNTHRALLETALIENTR